MATEENFEKQLALAQIRADEIMEFTTSENAGDVLSAYEQIGELISRLDRKKAETSEYLMDQDRDLEYIKWWISRQREPIQQHRNLREQLKKRIDELEEQEIQSKLKKELRIQQALNDEQSKFRMQQQKELEEATLLQQKREEEWYRQKISYQKRLEDTIMNEGDVQHIGRRPRSMPQTVKLQKYTITPFTGDFKDWLRFWNQFTVEVDGSALSEISKFNYLLELVKGKPRDDILGLPHSIEGYNEAKRILQQTYGKDIKVHKALIREIEELPAIANIHKLSSIHDFYNKLARVVRTLNTMNKLTTAQSTVYTLMDKLGPVREVLVQKDDDWEGWGLEDLVENLRKYVERNPLYSGMKSDNTLRKEQMLLGNTEGAKRKFKCVYCQSQEHYSNDCKRVLDVAARRAVLRKENLCFNCTRGGHMASDCRSRSCKNCKGKHHTSICDKEKSSVDLLQNSRSEKGLSSFVGYTNTLHPTLLAKIGPETVRVMFDTGAGSSYICTDLITKLCLKPLRKEQRCIEQMFGTMRKIVEVYNIKLESLTVDGFALNVECVNAEKDVLTYLPNPNVAALKSQYRRLRRLSFSEEGTTMSSMPIHVILGAADYQRIRTNEPLVLGPNRDKDPGAEFTMLGWTIYGRQLDSKSETEKQFFLKSSQEEFERLCSLDVLGVADAVTANQSFSHEEFKEQLTKESEGYYETKLPWKKDHVQLPSNKNLCVSRLHSTMKRLERTGKLQEYDAIMQEQIEKGIIEPVPMLPTGETVHYVPHQAVIREEAETTKMRIVYDCSARTSVVTPSLNDCLETGPSLQPRLFDIMLRNRMWKFCVTGDIKKAFLQVRISDQDRDALRILWYNNLQERKMMDFRFTRVIFGATSSPYILGAVMEKHINNYKEVFPATVRSLLQDTYVDDIQGGGETKKHAEGFKEEAIKILSEAGFELHKWHSNFDELDSNETMGCGDQTYAKSLIGNCSQNETKILGIPWNKREDVLSIKFESCLHNKHPLTKRKIIASLNSVFDILGWSSPVTITAKVIFSELCLLKVHWDEEIPKHLQQRWETWIKGLRRSQEVSVPRCIFEGHWTHFEIHGFADASKGAICAALYVVQYSNDGPMKSALLVAKSRVAPKNTSIPRLELIAAHTLAKLEHNVSKALSSYEISTFHNWVDSVTVLYWLAHRGEWTTFVRNRVQKVNDLVNATWKYVPSAENPSDLGTRGAAPDKLGQLWFQGPTWLLHKSNAPQQPHISETDLVNSEKRCISNKEALLLMEEETSLPKKTWTENLLNKFKYWKLLRVTSFLQRFISNCQNKRLRGPLTVDEIAKAEITWLKITQETNDMSSKLALVKDAEGLYRCDGRIQGYNPIFIPRSSLLARRVIEHYHLQTLHGGVAVTMSKVRETYWIPKLRSLVKSVRHGCNYCKRYRVKVLDAPTVSALPSFRTKFTEPFDVAGVDFAGPLLHKTKQKETDKAYVVLFTCASTRAVHLRLCKNMSTEEFKRSLKEFVARRGTPSMLVSDNAKTFKATKQWLKSLRQDDDTHDYLAAKKINWRFNMSRAPWWGGFFERLIGIMKNSLSKAIGRALLTFNELEEVLLDIEDFMNNRPLCYIGEEFDQPVITPNTLIRGQPTLSLRENQFIDDDGNNMTRRLRYLEKCRENTRKRWISEYLHALQERFTTGSVERAQSIPGIDSIVLIRDTTKNRANWKIGRIVGLIEGKDGTTRGFKIRTGNGYIIERPLQLVCNLEIDTEIDVDDDGSKTDEGIENSSGEWQASTSLVSNSQSTRASKTAAVNRLVGVLANENEDD